MIYRSPELRAYRNFRSLLLLLTLFFLNSCVRQHTVSEAELPVEPPVTQPEGETKPQSTGDERIENMLWRANRALRSGRLSQPEGSSALDYFQTVLSLQPDNAEALSGIDDIVLRYAQLVRDALAHSRWGDARRLIERAEKARPGNPLVDELQVDLASARQRQGQRHEGEEILLDDADLNRNSEVPSATLVEIARRIVASGEILLIVARTDAEGRWLYQQIKRAADGSRIRGDIKLGPRAKIVVLPPI